MKKLLLFAMSAMMAMPSVAQEVDVTHLIKNAGFDEDLTFQADGTMKEAVSTTTSLSDRSWAYIAADSTVYARPKSTSSQQRKDGRPKEDAVNGFKGRVKGWTLESNSAFPACEWTYFGTVSYDLPETAIPIADDGDTYLLVPSRPENGEFEAGDGFVYLRAGWTNQAIYKQVVNLDCAVYRLEYWTININPNTTATAKDLTQIQCRNDIFKDEDGTGLQATEWTKHEFTFTPTAEFTMQFGYQAANAGSGGQPIVALDGIKLYKIADANPAEIVNADLSAMIDSLSELSSIASNDYGYEGLSTEIYQYSGTVNEVIDNDELTVAEKEAKLKEFKAQYAKFKEAITVAGTIDALVERLQALGDKYEFPGKSAFDNAVNTISAYPAEGTSEQIFGAEAEAQAALIAYAKSQEASADAPADFTILVKNPWFIKTALEPTVSDGVATYENEYTDGSSTEDFTSEGWYKSGAYTAGDQRLNFAQGRSCWNAWGSSISTIGIAQDLTDLPNGYYNVKADLITQADYVTDQHVYASVEIGNMKSAALESGNWQNETLDGEWTTLSIENVLVTDGKLTIGAMGSGMGKGGSAGWFCATNFQLQYLGEAGDDALGALLQAKIDEAKGLADKMHFAADKKTLNDSIAKYTGAQDVKAALAAMMKAIETAQTSESKYEEYWMDGKTMPTLRDSLAKEDSYKAAHDIVAYAYTFANNWFASADASYTKVDSIVNLTKNYTNTYAPVYNNADSVANAASQTGKEYIQNLMAHQKEVLTSGMQLLETVNTYVAKLKSAMALINKQNIADDENATDFTAFIINPNAEGTDGWVVDKGNGDGPIKTGQWLDGTNAPYFDSWNANGLSGHKIYQDVTSLPNGTYTLGVYARTPSEGAYILTAVGADTTYVEIPLYTYTEFDENLGEDVQKVASDTRGPIWEEAVEKINSGLTEDDPQYAYYYSIANANGGNGRGWQHLEIPGLVVTDHKLCIGFLTGSIDLRGTEKTFAAGWYSVNGFTLTQTAKGDNSGWEGPIAEGVETVKNSTAVIEGIYNLNGVRTSKLQRGLNIVVRNGKAQKIFVK